jgi:outer membrane protein OmpT
MKKTLLALAVVAAAGSVNAAELMNTGTVSVNTDADFEVSLVQGPFSDDPNFSYDGAEITFGAESVINDNWTAFLNYGLEMLYDADDNNNEVVTTDIVAGFKFYQNHSIEFGQTSHVLDLGNDQIKNLGVDISNSELPSVTDIIVYDYTGESFGFGASVDLANIEGTDKTGYAVYLDGSFGDLYVRGDFGMGSEDATDSDFTVYGVKATYTMDAFSVGGSYVGSSNEVASVTTDTSLIDLWVGLSAGLDWYLGTQIADQEDDSAYSVYLNGTYNVNDVVGVYGEIGMADADIAGVEDDGFGYSIGMTMSF